MRRACPQPPQLPLCRPFRGGPRRVLVSLPAPQGLWLLCGTHELLDTRVPLWYHWLCLLLVTMQVPLLVGKGGLCSGLPAVRIFSSVLFHISQMEFSLDVAVAESFPPACRHLQMQTQPAPCKHNQLKSALGAPASDRSRLALQGMPKARKGSWLVCTEAYWPLFSDQLKPLKVVMDILCACALAHRRQEKDTRSLTLMTGY